MSWFFRNIYDFSIKTGRSVYEEEGPKRTPKPITALNSNIPSTTGRKVSQAVQPAIKLDIIDETGGKFSILI